MSETIPAIQSYIRQRVNEGIAFAGRTRYEPAAEVLEEAAALAREHGFADEEMNARITLGGIALFVGANDRARENLVRALELARALDDRVAQAKCLMNLGSLARERNPEEGIGRYREALALFQGAGDDLGTGQCLDNIGQMYRHIGSPRTAASYMSRAMEHIRRAGDRAALATHHLILGHLWTDVGEQGLEDPAEMNRLGREQYQQAAEGFRALDSPSRVAVCLDALGLAHSTAGECDEAVALHQEAVRLYREHGPADGVSRALLHLGNAYARGGNQDRAAEVFARVREMRLADGDLHGAANASHSLGAMLNARGDFAQAARVLGEAAGYRDGWARAATAPLLRRGMRGEAHGTWLEYLYALARTAEQAGTEDARAGFFRAVEASRSRLDTPLSGAPANAADAAGAAELGEEISLRTRLREAGEQRGALRAALREGTMAQDEFDARMARLVSHGTDARLRLEALLATRPADAPSALPPADPRDLVRALSARAGGRPCAVLYLVEARGHRSMLLGLVTNEASRVSVCPLDEAYTEAISRWAGPAITGELPEAEVWEAALAAMSACLGGILDQSGVGGALRPGTLLVLVPDGMLHLFPWEIAATGSGYLGIEHALVRASGATELLHLLRARPDRKAGAGRGALLFCPECPPPDQPAEREDPEREEVLYIHDLLEQSGFAPALLAGPAASPEGMIVQSARPDLRVLHFAGHSVFDPADPSLSALWMHADPDSGQPDGALTAVEIERRVRMPGRPLVFLNSCQSAVAAVEAGDDLLGLVRAFLGAGAGALVVSSGPVYRSSAPEMAAAAYTALAEGVCVADALRQARARVRAAALRDEFLEPGHLAHWGPYCASGDPLANVE
jgi:tetratricopeptide (TPR) repeat protein